MSFFPFPSFEIEGDQVGLYRGVVSSAAAAAPLVQIYNVPGTASYGTLNAGATVRYGEIFLSTSSLIGRGIRQAAIIMKKVGSPTGNVTITIRDGATDTIQRTMYTIDASTLGTGDTTVTTDVVDSYTIAANDKILVEYGGGNASNNVQVRRQVDGGAGFDGTNTHVSIYNTSYGTDTNRDIAATIWE